MVTGQPHALTTLYPIPEKELLVLIEQKAGWASEMVCAVLEKR
jgi:hypothetical protein